MAVPETTGKQRVPASERRDALIAAAMEEFAATGYHGTPVDRIARRVGVAQPYVFSLFGGKRDLFVAAVERGFDETARLFEQAATEADPANPDRGEAALQAMASAYYAQMAATPHRLMLQLQAYAACGEPVIREHVAAAYADMVNRIVAASGASTEQIDNFMRYGMWLNVGAAMGVEDLSAGCDWASTAAAQRAAE